MQRLLLERGWTQKQLADAAGVRPNTLTNIIKHGKDSDTATLSRIAAALNVDLAELFFTREQCQILRAYRENRIERLKEAVLKELSDTVTRLVRQKLDSEVYGLDVAVLPNGNLLEIFRRLPRTPGRGRRGGLAQ